MSPDSAQPKPRRRGGVLLPTIIVLGLIVISFVIFTGFYTDWLWFGSVDKSEVFTTTLLTRIGLFVGFGLLMGISIGLVLFWAYRSRAGKPRALSTLHRAGPPHRHDRRLGRGGCSRRSFGCRGVDNLPDVAQRDTVRYH